MKKEKDGKNIIGIEDVNFIRKKSKILFDGRQFVIKIPKDIERLYKLKKNKFIFEFEVDISKSVNEDQMFKIKEEKGDS